MEKNTWKKFLALGRSPSGFFMFFKVNLLINCHKVGGSIVMSLLVIFQPLYVRTFPMKKYTNVMRPKKGEKF